MNQRELEHILLSDMDTALPTPTDIRRGQSPRKHSEEYKTICQLLRYGGKRTGRWNAERERK